MRDLQEKMDMRPGSIYAGFGSKEGLFKQVLDHYVMQFQNSITDAVTSCKNPLAGLENLFNEELIQNQQVTRAPMCLLLKTVTELEESQPELAKYAQSGLSRVADTFAHYLQQAKEQGQLRGTDDPVRLAKWLQMQMMGLRLYAKNHPDEQEVKNMIEDVFVRFH